MGDVAIMGGVSLLDVADQLQEFQRFSQHRQYQVLQQDTRIKRLFVRSLQSLSPGVPQDLTGLETNTTSESLDWDDLSLTELLHSAASSTTLSRYYIYKLQWLYHSGQYGLAREVADLSETMVGSHYGTAIVIEHYFYQAIALIACRLSEPDAVLSIEETQSDWAILQRNCAYLKEAATYCVENFGTRLCILEAEMARLSGANDRSITDYYDQAIVLCHRYQSPHLEGLTAELAAQYHFAQGRLRLAQHYLKDACQAFSLWGATVKVRDLRRQLREWQRDDPAVAQFESTNWKGLMLPRLGRDLVQPIQGSLDWMTVLKASQTLSSEIVFGSLMEKLMRILIENAGAQRGLLVIDRKSVV